MHRQHGGSIGADTEEGGVTETDLAGKADQKIEPKRENGVDRHAIDDVEIEGIGQKERQDGEDRRKDQQAYVGALHTRSVSLAPNRPRGMTNRTSRMSTKGVASL